MENWNNSQGSYRIQISKLQVQHILTSQSYTGFEQLSSSSSWRFMAKKAGQSRQLKG